MTRLVWIFYFSPVLIGLIVSIWSPGFGVGLILVSVVMFLYDIHEKLVALEVRITEIQTDIYSDNRDRVSVPGSYVEKRKTVFHEILEILNKENSHSG